MPSLGHAIALAFLLLSPLIVAPASAQEETEAEAEGEPAPDSRDEQGRRLFTDGRLAFEEGRYAEALEYFRAAHELTERPELLYNVGLSAERAGERDEARESFERYLRARPDAENADEVRARLAILSNDDEGGEEAEEESSSSPWLWVGIGAGALVVAAVVVAIVFATSSGSVQDPLPGDVPFGGVVMALGGGR